ncbi:class I SAM-dependent methyltransferase [Mucilaginibacter segetis]|uniref:Class I SAM-dependent methyltransferase n=1 Tax=Mucilaginibacter segetis TaxID=2793071 RepID=A0A934PSI1_9SPHI|nr:class I SAM-dependent methyltransferase [Mucilaginibacter segetis]MBK0378230.1 class I SAM-dependent methyltransferase [Mucilaginibacter segetis]
MNKLKHCYDEVAEEYMARFGDELNGKHLDRILLAAFASENGDKGRLIDLGCGPGQTTAYLYEKGVVDIIGTDLSPIMVAKATQLHTHLKFEVADMTALPYTDSVFGSAIAFYSIVHFYEEKLKTAFKEIYRVLKSGADLLLSFHIGEEPIHYDNFLGKEVDIDFYFWQTDSVVTTAKEAGFAIVDVIERKPYEGIEYPSQRTYLWLRKGK